MTFITLLYNSATTKYEGNERPIVKVSKDDVKKSILYDSGAQQ
jgi:hypothetical protein